MPKRNAMPCTEYIVPWRLAQLPKASAVLLALSGGADSRALLHLLHASSQTDGFPLLLAHVNHGIRGEEAQRDLAFCRELAQNYGLELCVLNADVPTLAAQSGRGLEEEARLVRYEYFETLMREREIPILVTAHHADDHLETVLFRLARGTGLQGLGGIAPSRPFANGVLVRPLLRCTRREILAYCAENGLGYVTDSTNADLSYARNRIRAEVIPVLETLFDDPQRRALDMSADLRNDETYLTALAEAFLAEQLTANGIPLGAFQTSAPAVRSRVLRIWFSRMSGGTLSRIHVEEILSLLASPVETGAQIALPGGFVARREFGCLRLCLPTADTVSPFCVPFSLGKTDILEHGIRIEVEKKENLTKVHNLSTQTCIITEELFDIIEKGFYWRSRREGDLILQGGMHKKLRKLYNAAKVPARIRDMLPILCDREGIVWAPFVGMRDGFGTQGNGYAVRVLLPDFEN